MAGSLIDTLLQSVAAPRAAEPVRGADGRGGGNEFRPVLDDVLAARPQLAGQGGSPATHDESDRAADDATSDEEGESEVVALDAVDISLAAAEAGATVEASQPVAVTTTATTESGDAATQTPATLDTAENESAGGDAASKRAAQDSDAANQSSEIEIGDVQSAATKLAAEAPAGLNSLDAAAEETNRKSSAPGTAVGHNKEGTQATTKIDGGSSNADDAAQESSVSEDEASADEAASSEDTTLREAAAENASEASVDDEKSRDASRRYAEVAPTPEAGPNSLNDAPDDGRTSSAAPAPTAAQSTPDTSGAATPVAAVTAPTNAAGGSATPRNATMIARLSTERLLNSGSGQSDDVDASRFLGRVEGAVRAAHQRDGRVQVRLSPPELGALRIELTLQNGVMSARLEAETPAARNMLLDNLPALRDRLAQQDVRIDQFDVDVRRESSGNAGSGSTGQNGPRDRPAQEPDWRQGQQRQDRGGPALAKTTVPTARRDAAPSDAALDVRV